MALETRLHTSTNGATLIGAAVGLGTPGSVLFVGSLNQIAQNNANLFWDNTNTRLAVGSANPGIYKAKITGGNGDQLDLDNTGQQFSQVSFSANGSQKADVDWDAINNLFQVEVSAANSIRLATNVATVARGWDVTGLGNFIAITDNAFDIGASGASRPRTGYFGTSLVDPVLIGGTGVTSTLALRSTSGVGTAGADLIFQVGNNGATEAMRILNSGNVGIGTTSPRAVLDVSYTVIDNTRGISSTLASADNSAPFIVGRKSRGTLAAPTVVQNGDTLISFEGLGYDGAAFSRGAALQFITSQLWTTTALGSEIAFFTVPNGSTIQTRRLTIDQAGNVGLGTASPTNLLSLSGQAAQTVWMERQTTANTAGNSLTVQAGGATSGATDKNGGNLILASATATGTGSSNILLQTAAAGATGTVDRTAATVATIFGGGGIEIGTGTTSPGIYRMALKGGTATATTDWALTSGWGANATISAVTGNDSRGTVTVSVSALDTPSLNPVVTLTFKDGTWTTAPFAVTCMDRLGTGLTGPAECNTTATTLVIEFAGTPTALTAATYIFRYIVVG